MSKKSHPFRGGPSQNGPKQGQQKQQFPRGTPLVRRPPRQPGR